jgi:hypothetical protein
MYGRNDVIKNENFQKETLDQGIAYKISPKAFSKKRNSPSVGEFPF